MSKEVTQSDDLIDFDDDLVDFDNLFGDVRLRGLALSILTKERLEKPGLP